MSRKYFSCHMHFNKVIMYILPSRQESEILFEATRTCVWLELDVCSICVRFANDPLASGLINHQVKYFGKANNAFTILLHRRHGRFIVYQFKTVSLFLNRDSKVTKRISSSLSSSSSITSPSSTTRLNSAERSNRPFPSSLVPLFQSESKCKTFLMKMSSACSFIFMQIKVIFIRKVSHLHSFWNRGTRELGNGLLKEPSPSSTNCSDSTSQEDDVSLDNSSFQDIFH